MTSAQDAWKSYVGLAGMKHPTVKPWVKDCQKGIERELGYWPEPWAEMPPGGEPFDVIESIQTPPANGVETVVLQYLIPFGFDGVILGIANYFTGTGFVESSGDLIWRIRRGIPGIGGSTVRNYSAITTTMGSPLGTREVFGGILVTSEDYITYTVTNRAGGPIIPSNNRIVCNIAGFYWPRGSSEMGNK
jgi:hypothetical protein